MQKKSLQRLVLFGAATVLLISLAGLVSAQDPITAFFKDVWDTWNKGNQVSTGFIKILYTVLIALLVYAVSDNLPGLKGKNGLMWGVSIIVAFLSTYLFTQGDLYALLLSYSGLGFALGTIVPFLILVFFTYDLAISTSIKNIFVKVWLIRVLWISFGGFVFYKMWDIRASGAIVLSWHNPVLYLMFGVTIIAIIFAGYIIHLLNRGEIEGIIQGADRSSQLAAARERQLAAQEEEVSKNVKKYGTRFG